MNKTELIEVINSKISLFEDYDCGPYLVGLFKELGVHYEVKSLSNHFDIYRWGNIYLDVWEIRGLELDTDHFFLGITYFVASGEDADEPEYSAIEVKEKKTIEWIPA